MSKRRKKKYVITKEQIFDAQKPQYNGFIVGYGVHGKTKYNRMKSKQEFKRDIENS